MFLNRMGNRLSGQGISMRVSAAGRTIGVDGLTGHSLRKAAAEWMAERGASLPEIQRVGRWKSPGMPAHYTRDQAAGRSAVARLWKDELTI